MKINYNLHIPMMVIQYFHHFQWNVRWLHLLYPSHSNNTIQNGNIEMKWCHSRWWNLLCVNILVVKKFRCPHILVIKLVTNDHTTWAYAVANSSYKVVNDYAMSVGWKVDVNHTSYVIIKTKCYVIPFTTKISCNLSKANKHYNNQLWHLWLKN